MPGMKWTFLLVPVVALALAACGGGAAPASAPASSPAAPASASTAPKPAASSPAAAAGASASAKPAASASAKPAASGSAAPAASGLRKVRVGLSVAKTFEFEPANVVVSQGIDKQHGLQAEVSSFAGDGALQQALAAGAIDIGLSSSTASATAIPKGQAIKIVGQIDDSPKFMTIIVRPDTGIANADGLKGKTIGVTTKGAFTDYVVQRLNLAKKWGNDGAKTVALGAFDAQLAALKTKQDDGFVWTADGGAQLEKSGDGKIIFHADAIMPDFPFEVLVATDKLIKENPQMVKDYLAAFFDAVKFMKANKAQAIQLFAKDMDTPPDIAEKTYNDDVAAVSETGKISIKGFENIAQGITDIKAVDKPPAVNTLIDPQFLGTK